MSLSKSAKYLLTPPPAIAADRWEVDQALVLEKPYDTCAWTPNKVFMRLGSLGTWAWVPRLGDDGKS